jgi:tetratricopeptide (TPR) repeat protein
MSSNSEERNPQKSREIFNKAKEMRSQLQHDKAAELFKESLKYDHSNLDAINQVVQIYMANNQIKEGISLLERNIKIYPEEYTLHFQLAMSYSIENQNNKAIKLYEEIMMKDPEYTAVYTYLAGEYSKIGELEKAINCFKTGINRFPNNEYCIDLWHGLGILYLNEGMYYEASEALEQVIKIDYISGYAEIAQNYLRQYASEISDAKAQRKD